MWWTQKEKPKKKNEARIEFLSRLPIDECVGALLALGDESTDSPIKLTVKIRRLDEVTLHFQLNKTYLIKQALGRSDIFGNYNSRSRLTFEVLEAQGTFSQHSDGSTQILCNAYIPKWTYIPYVVLWLVPIGVISIFIMYVFYSLFALIVAIGIFLFSVSKFLDLKTEFDRDCGLLANLVRRCLEE